ncbi:hypothetical protein MTO96_035806 [Rhipicephalus appendiculatus]
MDANTANKKQKAHWTDEETRALLKVWEDHLADLRRAKRNMKVYLAMQECLRAQGIDKSVKEMKSKIENLANRYRNLKRKTTDQGAVTWRFYAEIAKFLSCQPINNSSLVEETTCEDTTVEMPEQEVPPNERTEARATVSTTTWNRARRFSFNITITQHRQQQSTDTNTRKHT